MELILKSVNRPYTIQYDGKEVRSLADVPDDAQVIISIPKNVSAQPKPEDPAQRVLSGQEVRMGCSYVIKVKQYMTKPASPEFDFMSQWNDNVPMPFRVMTGKVVKETRGMVMMDLHCEPFRTDFCMRCGRPLTHPVSKLYGVGPECGGHAHINPFETEAQLKAAIGDVRKKLAEVTWRGWIIKSAIEAAKEVSG